MSNNSNDDTSINNNSTSESSNDTRVTTPYISKSEDSDDSSSNSSIESFNGTGTTTSHDDPDDDDTASTCFITPQSRLFAPYGTLTEPSGKFVLNQADTQNFLALYNRKTWQICTADKLHRSVQGSIPHNIKLVTDSSIETANATTVEESDIVGVLNDITGQRTLVCTEQRVYVYRRGRLLCVNALNELLQGRDRDHQHNANDVPMKLSSHIDIIRGMIPLNCDQGVWSVALLVRSDADDGIGNMEDESQSKASPSSSVRIHILRINRANTVYMDHSKSISLPSNEITDGNCIVHPPTYMNKVVVSGCDVHGDGVLLLINVRTGSIVYRYKCVHKGEPVHAIVATPAVDTLAIATGRSHKVQIINLKLDRIVMTLQHNQRIESMTFSTMARVAYLAVASGHRLYIWDLTNRSLMHNHSESRQNNTILTCAFLPNSTTLVYSTRCSVTKMNVEILDEGAQDEQQQNTKLVELITRGGAKEGISALELGQYDTGLVLYGCGESLWRRHMYTGTLTRALTRENRYV